MTEVGTDLASSERWIVRNGVGIQVMETLAVGAFLTALAVELGASNFYIGLLAAIPHLSQLAQIPAVYTVQRTKERKKVYRVAGWIARPMLLVIAAAALIADPGLSLPLILLAFALRYAAGAFLGCAWGSWMRDLVPDREMGRVFSRRQKSMTAIGITLSITAAFFVDFWPRLVDLPVTVAYALVYVFAFLGGAYAVVCARRIYEPPTSAATSIGLFASLKEPFRHENYRLLIRFLGSWNFAINLAAPFFTVHMLKSMQLDLVWVIGFATLSQLAAYFTVKRWGEIADRMTNKAVLRVCGTLFVVAIFAWTFTTLPEKHAGTLPLLLVIHVVTGVATAGTTLAAGNITLKLAPKGNATAYLASSSMVNALAAGLAAIIGGATADLFASRELSLTFKWTSPDSEVVVQALSLTHWDFFFLSAFVFGLFALHRLSLVREDGEVSERAVVDAMLSSARQSLRNLSTVAGLRSATSFPIEDLQVDPAERR